MSILRWLLLVAAMVRTGLPANLVISTYLKDGFTPTAIASDLQGNIYLAGSAVIDAASQSRGAVVAKLDPKANQYLYLAYLDSAASDQVSSIAVDGSGNAYVTGWTTNPNFPVVGGGALGTTPTGSSDTRSFVTKLNPHGAVVFSVLIGGSARSTARGIALTPQGQILVSGIAGSSGFPSTAGAYNVADSTNHWFLMELDAAADKMIFSATGIGGSSIAMDAAGNIYVAGSSIGTDYPTTPGAYQTTFVQGHICYGLCQIGFSGALQHVTKVDPAGSKLIYSTGIALAGGKVWITGTTPAPDVPFSPGVLAPQNLRPGLLAGAYLSAVDFSAGVNAGPAIACVLDAGNLTHVGAVAAFQLISIFGANLGPAAGVPAPDGTDPSIAGMSVTFDGSPAPLLYVSASQINVAVPARPPLGAAALPPSATVMQLTVNGVSMQRQFPFTASNLNLFAELSANQISCQNANFTANGFQPVAVNSDGSRNSCTKPARYGSTVSFFVHGVGGFAPPPPQLLNLQAYVGFCSAAVSNASLINGFVYKVDVSLPSSLLPCAEDYSTIESENQFPVTLSYNGVPVGPLVVPTGGPIINFSPGEPMPMIVWVKQ